MKNAPSPPKHLGAEARALWRDVVREYDLDDPAGLKILLGVCESLDTVRKCQRRIRKEGMTYRDRWGQPRAHPLVAAERDARAQVLAGIKALNLDLEPLNDGPGRPPGK